MVKPLAPAHDRARPITVDVLLEFNGPDLVTAFLDDATWLGLAIDSDDGVRRWLYVALSSAVRAPLFAGTLPLRDPFVAAPEVLVVDEFADHDVCYTIAGSALPDTALPVAGCPIPAWALPPLGAETPACAT